MAVRGLSSKYPRPVRGQGCGRTVKSKFPKKTIKGNISKYCLFIIFFILTAIFVIYLMAIYITKTILESIQYFLYKKSD